MTELKRRIQRLKAGAIALHHASISIREWTDQIQEDLLWVGNDIENPEYISSMSEHDIRDSNKPPDAF